MAHHVLINGTSYAQTGGRVLVDGAGYSIVKGRTLVDGAGYDVSFGTPVGSLAVGSTVKLNLGASTTDFIVVHQGLPSSIYDSSCNGTWLLMKDIYENRQWHSSNVNDYANSTIHTYLNGTFFNALGDAAQKAILQVKSPYRSGSGASKTPINSGSSGLSAKIFFLSAIEVGLGSNSYAPEDGALLGYFTAGTGADTKRVANLNGSATRWWLRSPYCYPFSRASNAYYVDSDGSCNGNSCSLSYGVRPALVLDPTALVDDDGNLL